MPSSTTAAVAGCFSPKADHPLRALTQAFAPAPSASLRSSLADPRFRWNEFVALANHYLVTPALRWRLNLHGVWPLVPEPIREYCQATNTLCACKTAEMLDQATRVAAYQTVAQRLADDLPYLWLGETLWAGITLPEVAGLADQTLPDGSAGLGFSDGVFLLHPLRLNGT